MNRQNISQSRTAVLLTDFGQEDWYVGSMKGVILSICPDAAIVDLCHYVRPGAVLQGAWMLSHTFECFGPGSAFCGVVDPGVGSERRAIVAKADDRFYIAPDNGLLCGVREKSSSWECYAIENPDWMRAEISHTFHGRDIFAPATAHVLTGRALEEAGPPVDDLVTIDLSAPQPKSDGTLEARVVHIDHFGNVVLNVTLQTFNRAGLNEAAICEANQRTIRGVHETFSSVEEGQPVVYWGSAGFLEIAINRGSAAGELKMDIGDSVVLKD